MADDIVPVLDPDYNEGYPSPVLIDSVNIRFTVDNVYFRFTENIQKNQAYPSLPQWPDMTYAKSQSAPFPKILPSVIPGYNEDYPCIGGLDATYLKAQQKPYPKVLLALDPDYLEGYPNKCQELPFFGAFSNMPQLQRVIIPASVKFIEDYVFYNTGIEKVKIASDCVYFDHTFPEGCEIEYY